MNSITDRYYTALENQLSEITLSGQSLIEQYKASIKVCKKAMAKLKNYTSSYSFENAADEIYFFKVIKPQFYSKYIYYINVYNLLMKMPPGGEETRLHYINSHLDRLKIFFDQNAAFYQYYRSGATAMDEAYFTRGGFDVHVELEDFEEDEQYSTSHDYKLSKIIAHERFQQYLNSELLKLQGSNHAIEDRTIFPFSHPNWTAAKIDAVEIIYALKATGAVNNGNIDISELVAIWEFLFQIDLKEYYHKFAEITRRKREVPVFLNRLKEGLVRWIDNKMGL